MTANPRREIIPYQREDRDIYAGLEFNPDTRSRCPKRCTRNAYCWKFASC